MYTPKDTTPGEPTNVPAAQDEAQIICVIGGPGVGKGAQCTRLATDLNISHVSVGDLLRPKTEEPPTATNADIIACMQAGRLVDTALVQGVLDEYLFRHLRDGKTRFLVDGFPRSLGQAVAFKERGWEITAVLYFDSSEETMRKRMLNRAKTSNRPDDTVEIHKKRVQGFVKDSEPVLEFYEAKNLLFKVDCEGELDEIYEPLRNNVTTILDLPLGLTIVQRISTWQNEP